MMKKETCLIILLLTILIFICAGVGYKKILEGNDDYLTKKSDLNFAQQQEAGAQNNLSIKNAELATGNVVISNLNNNNAYKNAEIKSINEQIALLPNIFINNSIIIPAVYLPLNGNAINVSEGLLKTNDNTSNTHSVSINLYNAQTNLSFAEKDNKKCIEFKRDINNYLSFPFINPNVFTFSFWFYANPTDPRPQVMASITNFRDIFTNKNLNCSLEVDVFGDTLAIFGALPTNTPWSIVHVYPALTKGWTFLALSFDNTHTTKLYVKKIGDDVTVLEKPVSVLKGTGSFMQNDKVSTPTHFILGRSGCFWGGGYEYGGYIRDFYFYGITLQPKDIVELCKKNK